MSGKRMTHEEARMRAARTVASGRAELQASLAIYHMHRYLATNPFGAAANELAAEIIASQPPVDEPMITEDHDRSS